MANDKYKDFDYVDFEPEQIIEALKTPDGIQWVFEEFIQKTEALADLQSPNRGAATAIEFMEMTKEAGGDEVAVKNYMIPLLTPDQRRVFEERY